MLEVHSPRSSETTEHKNMLPCQTRRTGPETPCVGEAGRGNLAPGVGGGAELEEGVAWLQGTFLFNDYEAVQLAQLIRAAGGRVGGVGGGLTVHHHHHHTVGLKLQRL